MWFSVKKFKHLFIINLFYFYAAVFKQCFFNWEYQNEGGKYKMRGIVVILLIFLVVFSAFSYINSIRKEYVARNILKNLAEKYIKDVEADGY